MGWPRVFELRFRPDGTVKDVVTVLTTEHQLLTKRTIRSMAMALKTRWI